MRHYVRLSQRNASIDASLYPLGSCTMKHNPRLNEKMARLPGFARHPSAPAAQDRAGRARADRRAGALADRADRHAGRRHVAQGRRAWRAVRPVGHPRGAAGARRSAPPHPGARIRARHQSGDRGARRASSTESVPAQGRTAASISRRCKPEARARCRRADADQPQHLRPVRARHHRDRRRRARGRRLFLLRRRQFQRHRRPRAAGRSRHRRHAHQSAQDLLDAAWRRRARRGARGVLRRVSRPSRRCR